MAGVHFNLVRSMGYPPPGTVQLGTQRDGAGQVWSAVAHTQWGDIPAKAIGNTCWFGICGKEHETQMFSWVVPRSPSPMVLVMNNGSGPPHNALRTGHQTDGAGHLYAAIGISHQFGTIPGKAKDNTCWFPHGGREHETSQFYWVCHQ